MAKQGKLDPVIGRAQEIETVIEVLARRKKNNPVLIGEPGVGKTAIVEGLAQRMLAGEVPEDLRDKRVVELSVNSLVAGTQYRGQFEERVKQLLRRSPPTRTSSSSSSTSCTPSSGPGLAAERAGSTSPTRSSRCWPAAS